MNKLIREYSTPLDTVCNGVSLIGGYNVCGLNTELIKMLIDLPAHSIFFFFKIFIALMEV